MTQKTNSSSPPRELAKHLLRVLKSERMAATFIENYAKQFDRPEASAHPQRQRELEIMLGREMLLAMTSYVARAIELSARGPAHGSSRSRRLDPTAFLRELISALAKESGWTAGDAMEFRSDLEIYRRLNASTASRFASTRSRIVPAGPFVDRCAILLDPSMIENASRAAGKLLLQLEAQADKFLTEVLNQASATKISR
jgi:hypothetical protein